jgi:hypothetical protein
VGSGSDSGPFGAVLPALLRGALALRAILHVAAAPGGHSGGPNAAAAAGIDATGEVRRFEAAVDALLRPFSEASNAAGAPFPDRLSGACSMDRLLGAVASLDKAAARAWALSRPLRSALADAEATAAEAAGERGESFAWQSELLSLNLLSFHATHAALRVAATVGSGTLGDAEGTAALGTAMALCGDLVRFQRACEGHSDEGTDEGNDGLPALLVGLGSGRAPVAGVPGSPGSASVGWSLEAMPEAQARQVVALAMGMASLSHDLDVLVATRKKHTGGQAVDDATVLVARRLVAALAALREKSELEASAAVVPCSRILDSAANWRAVVAFGALAEKLSAEPAAALRPPAAVRAASFRSFLGTTASCLPELKAATKALETVRGAKVAQERCVLGLGAQLPC